MDASYILGFIALAELGIILALVNRLLESAGKRQIRPVQQVKDSVKDTISGIMPAKSADAEKIERDPGVKVGSYKIRL